MTTANAIKALTKAATAIHYQSNDSRCVHALINGRVVKVHSQDGEAIIACMVNERTDSVAVDDERQFDHIHFGKNVKRAIEFALS